MVNREVKLLTNIGIKFKQLEKLINSEPLMCFKIGAAVPIQTWQKTKPLTIEVLQKFWSYVESDYPLFDFENTSIQNWEETKRANCWRNETVLKLEGFRHRNGKKWGYVRWVNEFMRIEEATFKDGKRHGLWRQIENGMTKIKLFNDGLMVAECAIYYETRKMMVQEDFEGILGNISIDQVIKS